MQRSLTFLMVALLAGGCTVSKPLATTPQPQPQDDKPVHAGLLVLDTHVDIPPGFPATPNDPANDSSMQVDLPKMRAGGVDAAFFVVFVPQGPLTEAGFAQARALADEKFDAIHTMVARNEDSLVLATTAAQVREAVANGKLVALIGVENGHGIGGARDRVDAYFDRGARYMSLTHVGHNELADSSDPIPLTGTDDARHGGLSAMGEAVLGRMNDLGMMVDVSHASAATVADVVALSRTPVIASHSSVKALADVSRNLSDDQLRTIARTGGVVQIVAFDAYVRPLSDAKREARKAVRDRFGVNSYASFVALDHTTREAYRAALYALDETWPRPSVADFVDHIDHAVAVMGIDHVGIASDFGGGGGIARWMHAGETEAVTQELVARGYTADDLRKLWGENLLRVMETVEETAKH